jgi:uncharacterized membrane protein
MERDMANPKESRPHRSGTCQVCGQTKPLRELQAASLVRDSVAALIRRKVPNWSSDGVICLSCRNRFRSEYVQERMERNLGELDNVEQQVLHSLRESELIADNLNEEYEKRLTVGDRVADRVASFGGSWRFIFIFFTVIIAWIAINVGMLLARPFDPYPFILLNLFLSLIAAVQAPVIMMSQNRQADRDRLRAESDYKVNLKAEIEIRFLSEKLDQLIHHQWTRLLEIQQIQIEMIEDLESKSGR